MSQQMLLGAAAAPPVVSVPVTFVKSEAVTSLAASHSLTGIATDDLVIVAAASMNAIPAAPTGFNLGNNGGLAPCRMWSWLFATDTSMTISGLSTATGTAQVNYIVLVFRGVSKVAAFSGWGSAIGNGPAITPPAITTRTVDQMVVLLGMIDDDNVANSGLTAPGTFTLGAAADSGTDGNDVSGSTVMSAYRQQATAATVTPGSFTFGGVGVDDWIGYTLALVPATSTTAANTTAGQQVFTGSTTWTVPAGVTQVSACCIGGGGGGGGSRGDRAQGNTGGGGGALGFGQFIVIPGEVLTITVGAGGAGGANDANGVAGGETSVTRPGGSGPSLLVSAGGGAAGLTRSTAATSGGVRAAGPFTINTGGGAGGGGGGATNNDSGGGGGGAGGYSGNGGAGGNGAGGGAGAGGGGGGGGATNSGQGYSGGGVGLLGPGTNGTAGALNANGGGGSGGAAGTQTAGGLYGGGGGARDDDSAGAGVAGAAGAIRIIYGTNRLYPSTNVADV